MKCTRCGTEFEGDSCPNCTQSDGAPPDSHLEVESSDKKPYNLSDSQTPPMQAHPKRRYLRTIFEIIGVVLLLFFMLASFGSVPKSDYEKLDAKYNEQEKLLESASSELTAVSEEFDAYKEKMKPYEEMELAEAEAKRIEAEKVAADKKAAEEKAAADAAAAKAAEEAKGYETGITYDQLARTPDDFIGKKVKFYGKVVQVIEGSDTVQIRLAVDDNYDTVIYGEYPSSIVSARVLEDDYITVYGLSTGTLTYQSTLGGNITVPGVYIDKIDQ